MVQFIWKHYKYLECLSGSQKAKVNKCMEDIIGSKKHKSRNFQRFPGIFSDFRRFWNFLGIPGIHMDVQGILRIF